MKKWFIRETLKDKKIIYGNVILDELLSSRGIENREAADKFLEAPLSCLNNPYLMKDMHEAVIRIDSAIKGREKVIIYGDYDVDGIISTSILYRAFKKLGIEVTYYIPDRMNEGYGINIDAINYIKSLGIKLIITVDCGITSIDEVDYVKSLGMDIIITDHHECKESIPDTIVLNPKRPECKYPYKYLAGCGVAFKLVQALWIKYNLSGYEEYIDLAAIGTVADIVELTGENRIIVKNGIKKLKDSEKSGIKAIKAIAGISDEVNSYNISFQIAPRINAAGRLSDAKIAVELFTTKNYDKAMQLAKFLDQENKNRQEIEERILNEAVNKIGNEVNLREDRAIVLSSAAWHIGVVGIVASRILEKYRRPVFLICEDGNTARGSGRSIEGFNLFGALCECSDILIKFGGHEMAAGISLEVNNVAEFRKRLNNAANKINPEYFIDKLSVDFVVDENKLDIETATLIKCFEPFGCGNPAPVFCLNNTDVISKKTIGSSGQHLKYQLSKSGSTFDGVLFKADKQLLECNWKVVDTAFNININEWNNYKKVQLLLMDIKPSNSWITKGINESYYKNIKNSLTTCDEDYNFNEIIFLKEDAEFLKKFLVFKKGYVLISSIDSFLKLEEYLDLYNVSISKNNGIESQIIVCPDISKIEFGNNEVLICDFLPGDDIYKKLALTVNSRIYNFYSENIIDRMKTYLNQISMDKNLLLKLYNELVYNEVIGTLYEISSMYNTNPFKIYRIITYFKEKGIINVYVKEGILKIKVENSRLIGDNYFDSVEDIQYIKITKIIKKIQSILREE